ncbi:MAG: hypothetical protein HZC54_07750 [Verrucomicrobia bacterium]|nr:hypothetical protein [Verrucomicrobiota bacterium]
MKTPRDFHAMLALAAVAMLTAAGARAEFTILRSFAADGKDGQGPYHNSLVVSGSTLYGMTRSGGSVGKGSIFKINTDGAGYTPLHSFAGGNNDGNEPYGSLILSGSTLYGMTYQGGSGELGVVFKINTDGSGYTNLHCFTGQKGDGGQPKGSLTLTGSTLYGMTSLGGTNDMGVVFKVNTDGSGYTTLHSFAGGKDDGSYPFGEVTLAGSALYGMTYKGGGNDKGVIFKINTDGTGYANLHTFGSNDDDGASPYGSLTLSGSTLYGMTRQGGKNSNGTIFKLNTNGAGYAILYSFTGGKGDGSFPYGTPSLSGSTLYGMTFLGGSDDYGTAFKINTDGTGYVHLHSFTNTRDNGGAPYGSPTISGSTLYGMTYMGGQSKVGVIFKLDTSSQQP